MVLVVRTRDADEDVNLLRDNAMKKPNVEWSSDDAPVRS
jgi:hypothetical protein